MKLEHTLLIGPPGTGKIRWARALYRRYGVQIRASIDLYTYRAVGLHPFADGAETRAGFRAPHHTVSAAGLAGRLDGYRWRPGEVSLASGGILFLDELPEFSRVTLDVLREALNTGKIVLANASQRLTVPARFTLLAAANPCPCGWHGHETRSCICPDAVIQRYQRRIPDWIRSRCRVLGPAEYGDAGEPRVVAIEIGGREYTRNARGRCEDAPCCGCCTI